MSGKPQIERDGNGKPIPCREWCAPAYPKGPPILGNPTPASAKYPIAGCAAHTVGKPCMFFLRGPRKGEPVFYAHPDEPEWNEVPGVAVAAQAAKAAGTSWSQGVFSTPATHRPAGASLVVTGPAGAGQMSWRPDAQQGPAPRQGGPAPRQGTQRRAPAPAVLKAAEGKWKKIAERAPRETRGVIVVPEGPSRSASRSASRRSPQYKSMPGISWGDYAYYEEHPSAKAFAIAKGEVEGVPLERLHDPFDALRLAAARGSTRKSKSK